MKKSNVRLKKFILVIGENKSIGGSCSMMKYIELTIEEAMQRCEKNAKVFVSIQDLKDTNTNVSFVKKERKDYLEIFEDMQTAASLCDDFVKQLKLFSEKQDIYDIKPKGIQKTVLLRE